MKNLIKQLVQCLRLRPSLETDEMKLLCICVVTVLHMVPATNLLASEACPEHLGDALILCEEFEGDASLSSRVFDINSGANDLTLSSDDSKHGRQALKVQWDAGEVDAGSITFAFGRNPVGSQIRPEDDFRELFWRVYVKLESGFVGQPDKLTRGMVFATSNWAQAMVGHVWTAGEEVLSLDPASGIGADNLLKTTRWNDFANLSWLGAKSGNTPLATGEWQCVEVHIKLNSSGQSDGVFEYWIDEVQQAKITGVNWVGAWVDYGLNAVMLSNYWNAGSPRAQSRFIDSLVIATARVGCEANQQRSRPLPPADLM